ncbi:MAG: SAM-dependent methyltransferase [Acidobacteria bacterium 13_1_20CM_3_53_8]|nr:MAG: SAM-dependent methyltransferase [Acidobacteria bacterium 13_1_20CM_3_53_8]
MHFKDYFSKRSEDYAKYRPVYPKELFKHLASIAPSRELAWDCATGTGQAACALSQIFARVVATDASSSQLEHATERDRVVYKVARAEDSGLESHSVDLITVAQALHWFDLEKFYAEVRRVLKTEGALAVWSYNLINVSPEIDEVIKRFYKEIVGPYWPPERRLVEEGYNSVPFPFREIETPQFDMRARWTLDDLLGYLRTWSATQKFMEKNKVDPLLSINDELLALWGEPESEQQVRWPLRLRVGVV